MTTAVESSVLLDVLAGTPEAARDVVRQWLRGRVGEAASRAVIVNGSGLARESRLSAALLGKLFKNVPILARGGRDATTAFLQRNIGDALITFESEVLSIDREFGAGDLVRP